MKFLDGFKTWLGAIGLAVATVMPKAVPEIEAVGTGIISIVQGAFGMLTALGLIHKAEKRAAK